MYKISNLQKQDYQKNGYLILKNCLNKKVIEEMMDFVAHVITLELKNEVSYYANISQILNEGLISLKNKSPSSSSWIYQTILNSYKLKKLFVNLELTNMVMDLLEMKNENNLGTVSPAFRFDIPNDNNNIRTWHQDSSFFLENSRGDDHLVVWIPMNKATKQNGTVIVAEGSHKDGKKNFNYIKLDNFKSEQFTAEKQSYNKFDHKYIEADVGDVAFINMDLLHSSGKNVTQNEVRYTAQIRFNTINKKDYRPVFLKAEYPEYSRN